MVRRRLFATCLAFSIALLASFGECFATATQESTTGSFYGGYHHLRISSKERASLTLEFAFRTANYESGLLFVAVQKNHVGYLAAGLRDSMLEIIHKRGSQSPQTLHSFSLSFQNTSSSASNWHSLSLQYQQSHLSVILDSNNIYSQTLALDEEFSDLFLAGIDSFFSRSLFNDLSLSGIFIGCLANVTADSVPVQFVPDHQNGIGTECCLVPRTPMWCFQSTHSNVSIPTTLNDNTSIQISFNLQAIADGLVLFSEMYPSQFLYLQLSGHNLTLVISNSEKNSTDTLNCPVLPTKGDWHLIEVTLTSESARCAVGGVANDIAITMDLSASDVILGSAEVHGVHQTSFEGCVQHFKVNNVEIRPLLGNHLLWHNDVVEWSNVTFDLHPLVVDEGDGVRVAALNIRMRLPEQFFADPFAFLYQQELEGAIQIEVVEGPYQGDFFIGPSNSHPVSQFTYDALSSDDNETQIFYQHSVSSRNVTDEALIRASIDCGSSTHTLFSGTLEITVIENTDSPLMLTHNNAIVIAAGTSRVIKPSHVTVVGRQNRHPRSVTFSLQNVEARDSCERFCDERRGRLFQTYNPNLNVMFFSQENLNDGNISFQHFEKFGTEPVVIRLLASINGGYSINVTIDVYPYDGQITFLTPPGVCLFVKEGSTALLEPRHLNSTTNFEDQNPVISYDLIQEPRYGYFERFTTCHDRYPSWHPLTSVSPSASGSDMNFFTQDDINSGHVRYVHNHSSVITQESESFQFRLRSTNLTGDSESLCIHIVAQVLLVQPVISISAENIQVNEGGSVSITRDLLTTTPSRMEEYIAGVVDIEQMGIIYNLETMPSYGQLFVGERELSKGDNFTFDDVSSSLLRYDHSGSENHSDSFQIHAVATTTSTLLILTPDPSATVTVRISVTPVNNHLPRLGRNLMNIEPPEGGFVVITEDNILVTDEDRPNNVLTIFIKRKRTTPIGHFAFYDSPYTAVSRFSMQNVSDGRVIFKHWLGAELNLTQIIRLEDGDKTHYVREPIHITAVPLKLTVERQNSDCLANIDATLEQLPVTIQHNAFSIMLQDHLGQDKNLVPGVNVTVSSPPQYGQFNNRVSGEQGVSRFTVMALKEDAIEYLFANQSTTTFSDEFSWTFQYGSSVVGPLQFHICISPIPIPQVVHINNASVAFGGMVNLDSSNLLATDNRGGARMNDSLIYHIITPPQNGSIIDQRADVVDANLVNFTQTDVNQGRVVYQNKYSNMFRNMQDSFTFQVCTPYECTDPVKFFLHIRFVNITVLNTGFAVKEGGRFTITTSVLNIFAPPMSRRRRFYMTPERRPKHGNITLSTTPIVPIVDVQFFDLEDVEAHSVYYQNDGDEHLHDSFEFTATADYFNEASGKTETLKFTDMVNITIIPENDNSPEFVKLTQNLHAVKDGSTSISGALFSAHDYDSDMNDEDIVWELQYSSPIYGYLYLDEDRGKQYAVSSWTEGDLRANRLFYKNDQIGEQITNDFMSYLVTDGERKSGIETTFIHLFPIIFRSLGTNSIMVTEGENTTIITEHLRYDASNDNSLSDRDFLYMIWSTPRYGVLMFNGSALRVGSFFNQLDIRNGLLMYVHDHSNSQRDSFEYSLAVIDRINDSDRRYNFEILINSVDDDPPEVRIIQDPLFVVELSHVQINESALDIYDLDSQGNVEFDKIVCDIIIPPRYGLLPKSRFGTRYITSSEFTKYDVVNNQLWYNHTSLGHYEDSFTFRVTDGINPQNETYEVRIIILPSEVVVRVYSITVKEGHQVTLEREDFIIEHTYLNSIPGRFEIISPPSSGNISNIRTGGCLRRISEFTTVDLSNNHIIYCHNGKEIESDSFQFRYESLEPEGLHRQSVVKTMRISIKPVDDEPPIFARQRMSANIIYGQEIILNEQYLNVSDSDTTDLTHLNYTFTLNIHGHIAYSDNPKQSIRWFTQADVVAGRVKFIHDRSNELNGNIEFNVTDGKQSAFSTLDITIRELTLKCDENSWSKVSVRAGGEVVLTADHLSCYIIGYNNSGAITFSMSNHRHGYFVVGGEVRNSFTQEEINKNFVQYIHTDFEFWEEEERIDASARHNYVQPHHFHLVIHIQYPRSNGSMLAANEGLQMNEGESACLSESTLDVRNLRYKTWMTLQGGSHTPLPSSPRDLVPVFNLLHLPDHGLLVVNSTDVVTLPASFTYSDVTQGAVCYLHSGSEDFRDSIRFQLLFRLTSHNITDLDNQTLLNNVEESILMKITPVNDQRPEVVAVKTLTLVLGFPVKITADELNVVDRDSPPGNVTFTLLVLPRSAELTLGGSKLEANAEFTQADINNQRVTITPLTTTEQTEQFTLSFRDELVMPIQKEVPINYTVSKHELTISKNEDVTYQQNRKEVAITSDKLNTSTNGYRRETLFRIVSHPINGWIDVKGVGRSRRFSQMDVDEGRVMYIPMSNTSAYEDMVMLNVSNHDKELSVSIKFTSLAWGSVKENIVVDLTTSASQPLPHDLLVLVPVRPPEILVIEKPQYGVLEVGPVRQSGNNISFHYDDLTRGRVWYTWDYDQHVLEDPVVDNFTMLVLVGSMPPGRAKINLIVHPPKNYKISSSTTQPVASHHTDHLRDQFPLPNSDNEGFPLYSLFPILGVFLILVITIFIIVLFCIAQQKKHHKKWLPSVTVMRMYPWSVDSQPPGQGSRAMAQPNYDFDPTVQSGESDNEEHNSETSSGFSESVSPRHSPTQAFPVLAHSQQNSQLGSVHSAYGSPSLVPPRARSRARSNVSITFSSRQSVGSEVSIDDSPQFYSHSLPRPQQQAVVVIPAPVRPASHSAFSQVQRPNVMESGYNSGIFQSAEDSGVPSRAGSQAGSCVGYEEDDGKLPPFPSADVDVPLGLDERLSVNMLPTLSCPSDAGPGPVELKSSLAIGELNLNDPNILHMLRSPNPVLRKEEYWV